MTTRERIGPHFLRNGRDLFRNTELVQSGEEDQESKAGQPKRVGEGQGKDAKVKRDNRYTANR